jgi:hypothetical protein
MIIGAVGFGGGSPAPAPCTDYSTIIAADSPKLWYKLAETDAADPVINSGSSGASANGTYVNQGSIVVDEPALVPNTAGDGSVGFSTLNAAMFSLGFGTDIGDITAPGNWSAEAWISSYAGALTPDAANVPIFGLSQNTTAPPWGIGMEPGGEINCYHFISTLGTAGGVLITSPLAYAATWQADGLQHHVAATFSTTGNELILYVDGVDVVSDNTTITGPMDQTQEAGHDIRVGIASNQGGAGGGSPSGGIICTMDECAFYEKTLTPTEIADRYAAGICT